MYILHEFYVFFTLSYLYSVRFELKNIRPIAKVSLQSKWFDRITNFRSLSKLKYIFILLFDSLEINKIQHFITDFGVYYEKGHSSLSTS